MLLSIAFIKPYSKHCCYGDFPRKRFVNVLSTLCRYVSPSPSYRCHYANICSFQPKPACIMSLPNLPDPFPTYNSTPLIFFSPLKRTPLLPIGIMNGPSLHPFTPKPPYSKYSFPSITHDLQCRRFFLSLPLPSDSSHPRFKRRGASPHSHFSISIVNPKTPPPLDSLFRLNQLPLVSDFRLSIFSIDTTMA